MAERKDTPEQAEFRETCRSWLAENRPDAPSFRIPEHAIEVMTEEQRAWLCDWQKQCYEAGLVGCDYPTEYGGGGHEGFQRIASQEMSRARVPYLINVIGLGMAAPTILHHGSEEQKKRYLPSILTADEIWCQGYSEPGAGSDLANIQTRAVLRGDTYVVNGQKIWTSQAHRADWCFALVRTDPEAKKHEGIGFLLIDMRTPGIDVRPIVQITGASEFNEVFFSDVEVPASNLIGAPTQGWRIANTVLGYERGANTLSQYAGYRRKLGELVEAVRASTGPSAAELRDRLARLAIEIEVLRLNSLRQLTALSRGETPGPESSIQKLYWSELDQRFWQFGVDLQGAFGQLVATSPRALDRGRWQFGELNSKRFSIARGTSEIQRNIISERVLGLPRR